MAPKAPLADNTSFVIVYGETALDVTQNIAGYLGGVNDYGLWCRGTVDVSKRQTVMGTVLCLQRYALANIDTLPVVGNFTLLSTDAGGTEGDVVVNGTPQSSEVSIYIGSNSRLRESLPFMNATNILIMAFLEASQGN
jgi:hypothetical protein